MSRVSELNLDCDPMSHSGLFVPAILWEAIFRLRQEESETDPDQPCTRKVFHVFGSRTDGFSELELKKNS